MVDSWSVSRLIQLYSISGASYWNNFASSLKNSSTAASVFYRKIGETADILWFDAEQTYPWRLHMWHSSIRKYDAVTQAKRLPIFPVYIFGRQLTFRCRRQVKIFGMNCNWWTFDFQMEGIQIDAFASMYALICWFSKTILGNMISSSYQLLLCSVYQYAFALISSILVLLEMARCWGKRNLTRI